MEIPKLPIASGSFSSGPNDDVAAADVYKLKSSFGLEAVNTITSIQELSASIGRSIFDMRLSAGAASDFISKAGEGLSFNKDLLTNRILGTNSEFKASFNELSEEIKKGALSSTFKDSADSLMCVVNNTRSMVNSANIKDVRALGNFINKYTGSSIFSGQDKGAISGLLGSVITTASNFGISGAFTAITDTVNDTGIIGRITRAVLPIAVSNSDTRLLREIATGPAGSLINVFSPGFTQSFSKAFTYRGDRSRNLNSFEDIFTAFENIDDKWSTLKRGEGENTAVNILSLMGSSRDFQNLVMTGVSYWVTEQNANDGKTPPVTIEPMLVLASAYGEITVEQAIRRDFPKVALLSVYNARLPRRSGLPSGTRNPHNSNYIDPRTIKSSLGALFGY